MKTGWLILLAVAAFAVASIAYTPAPLLYAWGATPDSRIQAYGVQGTLTRGSIALIANDQRPVIRDLSWTLRPLDLLLLRLSIDVETRGDSILQARLSRSPFGGLRLARLEALIGVNTLIAAGGQPQLPVDGKLRLSLSQIVLDGGLPVQAEGTAELNGLSWTLARDPLRLGDYTATLSSDHAGILAVLASGAGPLELDGEAHLYRDRRYDLHLRLKPRPDADAQVQTLVRSIGAPDVQGWYHIRQQGSLQGS